MHSIDDESDDGSASEDRASERDPLEEIAHAAQESASGDVPIETWAPGLSLSYETKRPRADKKKDRERRYANAALIAAAASQCILVAMVATSGLNFPEIVGLLGMFAAFIATMSALYFASVAARDGSGLKRITAARIVTFLWMPLVLVVGLYLGANVLVLAFVAIVFAGIAGVLMIAAVIMREAMS